MSGVIMEPFTSIEAAERNFQRLNEAIVALQGGSIAIENIEGYENLATKQDLEEVKDRIDITDQALLKAVPVGTIFPYSGTTPPDGFLWLEPSSTYTKIEYPDLYELVKKSAPSLVDGETFKLCDSRGNFMRGYDPGSVRDKDGGGRELLSQQDDAIRNITGEVNYDDRTGNQIISGAYYSSGGAGWGGAEGEDGNTRKIAFDASRVVPTGSDNRPYNISVLYVVKAKNELIGNESTSK